VAVSTPWNAIVQCGEREEEVTGILQIGYPTGEEQPLHACKTQAQQAAEMKEEREKHLRCYKVEEGKGEPEPEGSVNFLFVDPSVGAEIRYAGSFRPRWTNGSGNGLNASKLTWEGEASGPLQCEEAACAAPATATGAGKVVGFEAQQLIQMK
jgi:hypothetical protein